MTLTRKITLLKHVLVVRTRIRSNQRMLDVARQIRDNEGYCSTIKCNTCPFDLSRRTCSLPDRVDRLYVLRMAQMDQTCD